MEKFSEHLVYKIRVVLELGWEIERSWDDRGRRQALLLAFHQQIQTLTAQFPELHRLTSLASKINADLGREHFSKLLVPLEYYSQTAPTDGQILTQVPDSLTAKAPALAVTFVLHNIRSAFNVGSILRSCDFFGLSQVVFSGYTPDPSHAKVKATAMGVEAVIKWRRSQDLYADIEAAKHFGCCVYAVDTHESAKPLAGLQPSQGMWFIFGHERYGLEPDILAVSDAIIEVPGYGHKNSLNVGVCAGVVAARMRDICVGQ